MDIEAVKAGNAIEEVVGEDGFTVTGGRRYRRTQEHDSLVIDTREQYYVWNSQGETGDVIDWVMRRRRLDFKGAVEVLCQRAHLDPPRWTREEGQAAVARRAAEDVLAVAGRWWVRKLRESEAAQGYCTSRGWTEETVQAAGLGYCEGDGQGLRGELRVHGVDLGSQAARAVLGMPMGMLVYPHVERGRVKYLAGRSVEGKRHYNLPRDLVGERKLYFNHVYERGGAAVVCEGQADAITWGQWGVPAIALAGCSADGEVTRALAGHGTVYLALDADEAGQRGTRELAGLVGPLCRVMVEWPGGATDANAALQAGVMEAGARGLLATAPAWVEVLAGAAGSVNGSEREGALRVAFEQVRRLDSFQVSAMRKDLAKRMGIGLREFGAMLKATEKANEEGDQDGRGPMAVEVTEVAGWLEEHLFETVYEREEERTRFAVRYPDGRVEMADVLELGGRRITPPSPWAAEIREGAVLLPDGLGEYESERELYLEVRAFVHRYLDVSPFFESLASYFVLFSYHFDSYRSLPYLRALGEFGTGKTRFIMTIGQLCYRPIVAAGASTTSPLMRMMGKYQGTLIIDEGDFRDSDEANVLVKILNQGAMVGFPVLRSAKDQGGGFTVETFRVFCPKVIASRKRWEDEALESRCLTYETGAMIPRWDIPRVEPHSFEDEARVIRNKLLTYRLRNWQPEVDIANEELDLTLEPRYAQVTAALKKTIRDPDLKEELDGFLREHQVQAVLDRGMTLEAKVLQALLELGNEPERVDALGQGVYDFTIKSLAQRVNAILDDENRQNGEDDEADQDGQGEGEEDDRKRGPRVGVKKVGWIVRNKLQLKTARDGHHGGRYAVVWDDDRLRSLAQRYGMEGMLERESTDGEGDSGPEYEPLHFD
jgi:DNA primase